MQLDEIIKLLEENSLAYSLHVNDKLNREINFIPASLKNIIPNGFYYIQDAKAGINEAITESLLITNVCIETSNHIIVVDNPQLVHYKLLQHLHPEHPVGIHPTAIISPNAQIAKSVSIGPYCIIGNCVIGEHVCLRNQVVIEDNVTIHEHSYIDSQCVIGAAGLAWIWDDNGERIMQPQLGGVIIEANCLLATDITVVRGSLSENTRIGEGTVIAHGTKIGHGTQIGTNVHMANNVSLAGNAVIGDHSFLGSACVVSSNIEIPNHTIVGAGAVVSKNFKKEYLTLAGVPAIIIKENNYESKPNGVPKPFKK